MQFHLRTPGPPLEGWVRALWYAEQPAGPLRLERVLPGGNFELIVNLQEDVIRAYDRHDPRRHTGQRGALLVGASEAWSVIDSACQQRVVGVQFRPGGVGPFLGCPAPGLRGREVELADLWGAEGGELRDRLRAAAERPRRAPGEVERRMATAKTPAPCCGSWSGC